MPYRITTTAVIVPDHLQRDTGLPGDPQGDIRTGYAETRRELEPLAHLDRANGGSPEINPYPFPCPKCGEGIHPARLRAIELLDLELQCIECAEHSVRPIRVGVTTDPDEMRAMREVVTGHD